MHDSVWVAYRSSGIEQSEFACGSDLDHATAGIEVLQQMRHCLVRWWTILRRVWSCPERQGTIRLS